MAFWSFRWPGKDDQLITVLILVVFMISAGFFFWQRSITNNGLVDFEDLPALHAEYLVDINEADWPEFSNLPGIGEKLAKQIVQFREQNGPFRSPDDLIQVSGIGDSKLEGMLPHVVVEASSASPTTFYGEQPKAR